MTTTRRWPVLAVMTVVALAFLRESEQTGAQIPPLPLPTSTTVPPERPPDTTPPDTRPPDTAPPETSVPPDTAPPEPSPAGIAPEGPPTTSPRFDVGPSPAPTVQAPRPSTSAPVRGGAPRPVASSSAGVAAAVSGSYALGVGVVLLVALLFVGLSSRAHPGGPHMHDPRRRWRLLAGLGCLALAAIVGLVGWLKLSLEPEVNRQIPYLASAGMALVLLAAIGGSLLVAEQLRADDERLNELEDAVRQLATTLAPIIQAPARRGADAAVVDEPPRQERRPRRQPIAPR